MLLDVYLHFFGIAMLLALAPGPDNAFLLALSAEQGFRRGLLLTFGLCSGLVIHTLLAVTGLSALLMASSTAFALVSGAGALYLIWLALGMWNSGIPGTTTLPTLSPGALYRRGLIMNLSNPKVVVFFVALLPQFAGGSHASPAVLIVLGIIMMVATLLVFGSLSLLGGALLQWRHWPPCQRWLNRITAIAMITAALHLLWHYLP